MKQAITFRVMPGWKLLLDDMGINSIHVLAIAGLPADLFLRQDATLTIEQYFRFVRGLEEVAGDQEFPLMLAQAISAEAFDPPVFASLCSPNLNIALQRLSQYKRLIGPMNLKLEIDQKQTTAEISFYGYTGELPGVLGAMELVFFTELARLATRKNISPLRVELSKLPKQLEPYQAYFGAPIHLASVNRISFSANDALQPFLCENAEMWGFFQEGLNLRLSQLDSKATTVDRVRAILLEMLPSGQSSIEEVAQRLAVSRRSLQRRLSTEASSYQLVVNEVREELAHHYLANSELSSGEISFLLGFQDGNSFIRAFNNWTGVTPGEYRKTI